MEPVEQLDVDGVVNMIEVVRIAVDWVVSGVVFSPPPPVAFRNYKGNPSK